jgi:hypothetical protein
MTCVDDQAETLRNIDAVLVSLDRLKNLKAAFPNYFGMCSSSGSSCETSPSGVG